MEGPRQGAREGRSQGTLPRYTVLTAVEPQNPDEEAGLSLTVFGQRSAAMKCVF